MLNEKYVELVFVRHNECSSKIYLFQAPAWSSLKKGDLVMCKTSNGLKQGTVVAADDFTVGSEDFNTWVDIANARLPLKKIAGVFKPFVYEDEEKEEGGDCNE